MHPHAAAWIGTAGWTIPRTSAADFPGEGTHLQRYARVLTGAEINSSFYRPHKPSTYAKWAAAVPPGFRFAVKVPKEITHVRRLGELGAAGEVGELLERFLAEAGALETRLGPLLVQLPPSLAFVPAVAKRFFMTLRRRVSGPVVCEPRHATWFLPAAQAMLTSFHVAQVAADPAISPAAARPGGWGGLVYYRLHGSPTIYRSQYTPRLPGPAGARPRRAYRRGYAGVVHPRQHGRGGRRRRRVRASDSLDRRGPDYLPSR